MNKIKNFQAPLNIIDLLAILPYFLGFLLEGFKVTIGQANKYLKIQNTSRNQTPQDSLMIGRAGKVLRLVRVMRILRVFKVDTSSISNKYITVQKSQLQMLKLSLLFSGCSTATNCIFIGQIQNLLDIPHDLFFFSLFDTLLGFSHFCPLWHRFTTNVTNNRPTNAKILLIILITILP